jgi:hypothetical protein
MNNETMKVTKGYEIPLCQMLSVDSTSVLCQSLGSTTEDFIMDDSEFGW